jgi:hypothetical protein
VWSAPNHKAFLGICVKFVDPDAKEALQALLALSELPGLDGPGSHGGAEQWKLLQHVCMKSWIKSGIRQGYPVVLLEAEGIKDNNIEGLDDSADWQSSNPDSV